MNQNRTMKQLPESERPYEKCEKYGPGSLSDSELLAAVLQSGRQGMTALEVALELLSSFGNSGLVGIARAQTTELMEIPGIGKVKALQIRCIGELARRISRQQTEEDVLLTDPASVAGYFMEEMRHLEQEVVIAAFFNTRGKLLRWSQITRGTVNSSLVSPREIFMEALRSRAVYLILLHNHPSGDPEPRREDLALTQRVKQAGDILQIPLYDHIIIGDQIYISFHERGYLE